jgi:hypothetical protein
VKWATKQQETKNQILVGCKFISFSVQRIQIKIFIHIPATHLSFFGSSHTFFGSHTQVIIDSHSFQYYSSSGSVILLSIAYVSWRLGAWEKRTCNNNNNDDNNNWVLQKPGASCPPKTIITTMGERRSEDTRARPTYRANVSE